MPADPPWSSVTNIEVFRTEESCCQDSRYPSPSRLFMALPTTCEHEREEKHFWGDFSVYKRQISVRRQLAVSFLWKIIWDVCCVVLFGFISLQRTAQSNNLCYKGMHLQKELSITINIILCIWRLTQCFIVTILCATKLKMLNKSSPFYDEEI